MATKKDEPLEVPTKDVQIEAKADKVSTEKTQGTAKVKAKPAVEEKKAETREPLSYLRGPVLLGAGLLILGIVLLVGEILGFRFGAVLWPFIFIVPGGMLFISALSSTDQHGEGVAILGSMMMMLGIIFLLQQILNMWASWAYVWALLAPTSIGIAQVVYGKQRRRDSLVQNGKNLIEVGFTLFFVFFVFFEVILNVSQKMFMPFGLPRFPVALIILGIFVIVRALIRSK